MKNQIIDIEGLRRLSGNDEAFISEILKLYTDQAAKDVIELENGSSLEDWNSVRFVVHRMRSSAVPLGLKDLVVLLKKVEMKLKEDIYENVQSEIEKIIAISKHAIDDAKHQLSLTSA
ncbi:Hpt domain-containing protein [Cryomorpha ignava]|uniref:Hpt domain-containing protein n=1 Tax=Cryomorpha ignava TaxID=101383 RepID=A0A7K3WTD7_9FLAO|nr:Hpt domain-containing protein [Cryomorpha ignava]NEN24142.1 Hpt domain-containing protein [Cryomorpha ignava]